MKKFIASTVKVLMISTLALFVVYFWSLDQKLMAWVYTMINRIHDRRKVDIKF